MLRMLFAAKYTTTPATRMKSRSAADVLRHNTHLVLLTCGLLVMLGLGARELSSFDESLFALRARAVVEKDAGWDQSLYLPESTATASNSPLLVWAMSVLWKPGSGSVFIFRLWPALCSMLSLFLLYRISRTMLSARHAMMLPVLLAGCLIWNDLARTASALVPGVTMLLASVYAAMEFSRSQSRNSTLLWSAAYGASIAAVVLLDPLSALLGIAMMPLVVSLPRLHTTHSMFEAARDDNPPLKPLIISGVAGIAVSVPIVIRNISVYGTAALIDILQSSAIIGRTGTWCLAAPLLLVRDLLVAQPLFVWGGMAFVASIRWRKENTDEMQVNGGPGLMRRWILLCFVFVLIPWYSNERSLLIIPLLSVLTLRSLSDVFDRNISLRAQTAAAVLVLMFSVVRWYPSMWRGVMYGTITTRGEIGVADILFLPCMVAIAFALSLLMSTSMKTRILVSARRASTGVLPVVTVLLTAWGNATATRLEKDGAKEVALWCEQTQARMVTVLVRSEYPLDTLVPQLAWYTKGWLGFAHSQPWRPAYGCTVVQLKGDTAADSIAIMSSIRRDDPIVYMGDVQHSQRERDMRLLGENSVQRKVVGRYAVYSRIAYSNGGDDESED